MSNRNLINENIRFDTPWLIDLLNSKLKLNISPSNHCEAIRRFLLGENLTPLEITNKKVVQKKETLQINIDMIDSLDAVIDNIRHKSEQAISSVEERFEGFKLNHTEIYPEDSLTYLSVFFDRLESDSEFNYRKELNDTFNKILSHKDAIYAKVDEMK